MQRERAYLLLMGRGRNPDSRHTFNGGCPAADQIRRSLKDLGLQLNMKFVYSTGRTPLPGKGAMETSQRSLHHPWVLLLYRAEASHNRAHIYARRKRKTGYDPAVFAAISQIS